MNTGNEPPVPAEPPPGPDEAELTPAQREARTRQRSARGNFERSMTTVQRDAHAAELRAQGLTYQQIGDQLGINKGDAWRAVHNARADVARPAVTKLIQTESEELDSLYVMAMEVIETHHVTVSHGKVVTWLNPETQKEEPLPDDGPKLAAIQTALRIRESYRKLHGLDAEQKVSVAGSVRYEVVGVTPEDLT